MSEPTLKPSLTPSYLAPLYPWGSVFGKYEYEEIAQNVMKILERTGDTFRLLSWDEYKSERIKDIKLDWEDEGKADLDIDFDLYLSEEKTYFEKVAPYCQSGNRAALFCKAWKDTVDIIGTD